MHALIETLSNHLRAPRRYVKGLLTALMSMPGYVDAILGTIATALRATGNPGLMAAGDALEQWAPVIAVAIESTDAVRDGFEFGRKGRTG